MVKTIISVCKGVRKFSDLEGSRFGECPAFDRARILKIGDKDVLYQQAYSRDGPYVLVPGYITSDVFIENGKKCCNIYPIKDKFERAEIENMLATKAFGNVNFWN